VLNPTSGSSNEVLGPIADRAGNISPPASLLQKGDVSIVTLRFPPDLQIGESLRPVSSIPGGMVTVVDDAEAIAPADVGCAGMLIAGGRVVDGTAVAAAVDVGIDGAAIAAVVGVVVDGAAVAAAVGVGVDGAAVAAAV
jgi:hypothetical protein